MKTYLRLLVKVYTFDCSEMEGVRQAKVLPNISWALSLIIYIYML
jgi:hypothetical protein